MSELLGLKGKGFWITLETNTTTSLTVLACKAKLEEGKTQGPVLSQWKPRSRWREESLAIFALKAYREPIPIV
jgi:hypothetical protein